MQYICVSLSFDVKLWNLRLLLFPYYNINPYCYFSPSSKTLLLFCYLRIYT